MSDSGHPARARGGRFAAPAAAGLAGARLASLAATSAIHVLAIAGVLAVTGVHPVSREQRRPHLTVMPLPPSAPAAPPPPDGPAVRKAAPAPPPPPAALARQPSATGSLSEPEAHAAPLPELPAAPPAMTGKADAPPPAPAAQEAGSLLADYMMLVWRRIDAHRPRGVRLSGTVQIAFRIAGDGAVVSAEVARPSGNPNLDRIALRAVRQASPMPRPPEALTPEQLAFVVPLHFH